MPRRKRNADLPKRGMTAYMIFCQEKRPEVKKNNPDVGFGQLGKLLGEAWKELPESDKSTFNEQAAKDKIRYQKELATYKATHPESSDDEKKPTKKKRKKEEGAPKKACSAFFHFSTKIRPKIKAENPSAKFGDLGKLIGAAWQALPAEDKKEFEEAAEGDKKRYEKERKEFEDKKKKTKKASSSSSESESESDSGSDSNDSGSGSDSEE